MNTLIGRFIRLEPLKLDHLPGLRRDFEPKLFTYYPKPYSHAREFVEENLANIKRGDYEPFAIVLQSTGESIGCTEFCGIDEKNRKLEIGGSWIKPAFQRTAANAESKFLLLRNAFEEQNFVRVQFTTNVLNQQSRAALEKIGAKFEGVLRNAMILPDRSLRDDAYYSIIKQEWPQVSPALQARIAGKLLELSSRPHA